MKSIVFIACVLLVFAQSLVNAQSEGERIQKAIDQQRNEKVLIELLSNPNFTIHQKKKSEAKHYGKRTESKIYSYKILNKTKDTMQVEVKYYASPNEGASFGVSIYPLIKGKRSFAHGHRPEMVDAGKGTAYVRIYIVSDRYKGPFKTDELAAQIYNTDPVETITTKFFPYKRKWRLPKKRN